MEGETLDMPRVSFEELCEEIENGPGSMSSTSTVGGSTTAHGGSTTAHGGGGQYATPHPAHLTPHT